MKMTRQLVLLSAALLMLFCLSACGPKYQAIRAEYSGDTAAGTVINDENENIKVFGITKDGEEALEEWTIEEPVTLEADTTSTVIITCDGQSAELTIECTTSRLEKISAEYTGDTSEGVVLDEENKDIVVTAFYKNGESVEVADYTIDEAATLSADETASVTIRYEDQECKLEVQGTPNAVLAFVDGFNATAAAVTENEKLRFRYLNMDEYESGKGFVVSPKIRIELNVSEREIKPEDEVRSFMLVVDDYGSIDPLYTTAFCYCCVGGLSPEMSYEDVGSTLNALAKERGSGMYGSISQNGVFYSMAVASGQFSISGQIEE